MKEPLQIGTNGWVPVPLEKHFLIYISIEDLIGIIAHETGYEDEIRWDSTKPNGQPCRNLDVQCVQKPSGFESSTSFENGLRETIRWYEQQTA